MTSGLDCTVHRMECLLRSRNISCSEPHVCLPVTDQIGFTLVALGVTETGVVDDLGTPDAALLCSGFRVLGFDFGLTAYGFGSTAKTLRAQHRWLTHTVLMQA